MGLATFLALLAFTQYLVYQRYLIAKEKEHKALMRELVNVRSKFRSVLHNNITAANTLVIICKEYGVPANFDRIAAEIMATSKYVDAIQLTDKGVISHVYPLSESSKKIIGINTFADSMRKEEALKSLHTKGVFFVGPRKLRLGGDGILGKVPIFVDGELKGFSIVLTTMATVRKALELDQESKKIYAYSLTRTGSRNNADPIVYPLNEAVPKQSGGAASLGIPEGEWVFSVAHSTAYSGYVFPVEFSVLGAFFSILIAALIYRKMKEPEALKKVIESKTRHIANSEKYYRTLIETSSDAIVLIDREGNTIYQTPSTEKIGGYSLAEMQQIGGVNLVHPDDLARDGDAFIKLLQTPGSIMPHKHRVRRKDGEYIWIEGTYRNMLEDESVGAIVYSYSDVTERHTSLEQIKKYNLELTLLNNVNDIILHAQETKMLFDEVCQGIVDVGKYKLAWIGEVPADVTQTEELGITSASGDLGYLKAKLIVGWDELTVNNPVLDAVNRNEPTIINNTHRSPEFAAWCDDAKQFDIESVVVLPLNFNNTRGALAIYSAAQSAFGAHELAIFKRLAGNISLAVRSIQNREDKEVAVHNLQERIKELSTIYQLSNLLQNEDRNQDEVFLKIIDLLPGGWQYPEICAARIEFNGSTYQSANFIETEYMLASPLELQDGKKGMIEIVYLERPALKNEEIFLKEEQNLLQTICATIEVYFDKSVHKLALTKSEANLRSIFENTEIGYVLLDANLDIVSFNQYMRTNYKRQSGIELKVGDNFITTMQPERGASVGKMYRDVMARNKPEEYETEYTNGGDTNHFWVNLVPVRNNGEVTGLCLAIFETTKLKNLERERERIIRDLTNRNTDLEQFAQIVSHNLRGPLSTILGVNLLLEDPMPEEEKDALIQDIRVASNRLDTVIMDLNEILQARDITESKTPIDLETLMKDVQGIVSTMVRDSGAVIECDFAAVTELKSVRSFMSSIFCNLITNSIKFAKPGEKPFMKTWTEQRADSVIIYHKDNGMGIDLAKHREKVFQLYERFHLDIEGKGLGLFMTKTQVETLGGTITVDSNPGEGCVFTITLPF